MKVFKTICSFYIAIALAVGVVTFVNSYRRPLPLGQTLRDHVMPGVISGILWPFEAPAFVEKHTRR